MITAGGIFRGIQLMCRFKGDWDQHLFSRFARLESALMCFKFDEIHLKKQKNT